MANKLYINGDSHSAGAELHDDYCFTRDDPEFMKWVYYSPYKGKFLEVLGETPHYHNVAGSYGAKLADMLNRDLVCDAMSGASNERIIRTTDEYLDQCGSKGLFIVIGWSTWERLEMVCSNSKDIETTYYQLSASGSDTIPEGFDTMYKNWIANLDTETLIEYEIEQHRYIWDFHRRLQERNVKHFFFNTFSHFENIKEEDQKDWDGCYFHPYEQSYTFYHYLKNSNYEPNENYHHDKMAHREWANVLFDKIRFMM